MNQSKFSDILLNKTPKQINKITEETIDILFNINEFIRELNSVDFCNPLGYILTKSLPPEGLISKKLNNYGGKITKFINKVENLNNKNNNNDLINDIEEVRLSLEEIIPDEELKRIIPGGDGILKTIQNINDSLVITNTLLSPIQRKQLLNSFKNRLIPLSNPINLTELLLNDQINNLNKKINKFIKPERFRKDLEKIIKEVIKIDKSISRIQSIILLMNKIIKAINTTIKIINISIRLVKMIPIPAKYVTVGSTVSSSSKVTKFELQIGDLSKILNATSIYITTSVIKQISRIRKEIFILLISLNQLLENLKACSFFSNDDIINNIQNNINSLNNNIITINNLFPSLNNDIINNKIYKGYNINIINEETTDNNTSLFRRRIIVTNSNNIIEYEGTPTYSNKDYILIKEGQFYIDSKFDYNTEGDNINEEEISDILKNIGMDSNNIEDASKKEKESNLFLLNQINNSPEDKKFYNNIIGNTNYKNPEKIEQVKKITNNLRKLIKDPKLFQVRLRILQNSLLDKGFTLEEIQEGIKN
jgi:hypothetical protein